MPISGQNTVFAHLLLSTNILANKTKRKKKKNLFRGRGENTWNNAFVSKCQHSQIHFVNICFKLFQHYLLSLWKWCLKMLYTLRIEGVLILVHLFRCYINICFQKSILNTVFNFLYIVVLKVRKKD